MLVPSACGSEKTGSRRPLLNDMSRWCSGSHPTLRRSWSSLRFQVGILGFALRVCRRARRSSKPQDSGSIPRRGTWFRKTCPRGVPDQHATGAKVEDQVQFLARTLDRRDAGARRHGNRLQSGFGVGSTPTGVFWALPSSETVTAKSCGPRARRRRTRRGSSP